MQYGPENGLDIFRSNLADFLSRQYQADVLSLVVWNVLLSLNTLFFCSDELFVTAGATHGVNVLSSVFFEAGDTIYVEDPSYFIAFKIFKTANFNIVGGKNRHIQLIIQCR